MWDVGVLRHCSRALHLRDLISRKVNQAGRGIFAYLISKYFCYCRAFQLILVIERASSLPQLLSPAANWLIQAAPFILWRGDKFLSRSQTLVLSNAFLTGDNRKLLSVDLFSLEKGDKDGDWERGGHSKAIGLSRPYWWWLENPSNAKCL